MGRKKNKDRRRKKRHHGIYSSIQQHKRVGKELITPLNTMDKMSRSSWRDDHAPELLWAFLLTAVVPRDHYLACFREVATWAKDTFPRKEKEASAKEDALKTASPAAPTGMPDIDCEVDHTSIARFSDEQFKTFSSLLLKHPLAYGALRPLLLIDCLPAIERWRATLAVEPTDQDWSTLADAIVRTIDHQSEQSTDTRWLKIVIKIISGKLLFPEEMRERTQEVLDFPNKGDMRSVRPFIRAGEMNFRRRPPSTWISEFWKELMAKTHCIDGSSEQDYSTAIPAQLTLRSILDIRQQIADRFHSVKSPERTDARLDSTFGLALYAMSLLEEIAAPPISQLLLGRIGLRALAEAVITFAYLVTKDEPSSWEAYRNYGTGIAKLTFLKLEQTTGDVPSFVDSETLLEIANEDLWHEFVNVNLGHWANLNVRELALGGGTKDVYDTYYDWTSHYSHGQWGAVRDSNFVTCHNPLHRLHRIPRPFHRLLPTVVPDAVKLANMALELLERAYPTIEKLRRIVITPGKQTTTD
jgi:hypothetical protein